MMSGLVEQLYVGRCALFDLETIKCAFQLEESYMRAWKQLSTLKGVKQTDLLF